jgi:hypothetical protein
VIKVFPSKKKSMQLDKPEYQPTFAGVSKRWFEQNENEQRISAHEPDERRVHTVESTEPLAGGSNSDANGLAASLAGDERRMFFVSYLPPCWYADPVSVAVLSNSVLQLPSVKVEFTNPFSAAAAQTPLYPPKDYCGYVPQLPDTLSDTESEAESSLPAESEICSLHNDSEADVDNVTITVDDVPQPQGLPEHQASAAPRTRSQYWPKFPSISPKLLPTHLISRSRSHSDGTLPALARANNLSAALQAELIELTESLSETCLPLTLGTLKETVRYSKMEETGEEHVMITRELAFFEEPAQTSWINVKEMRLKTRSVLGVETDTTIPRDCGW